MEGQNLHSSARTKPLDQRKIGCMSVQVGGDLLTDSKWLFPFSSYMTGAFLKMCLWHEPIFSAEICSWFFSTKLAIISMKVLNHQQWKVSNIFWRISRRSFESLFLRLWNHPEQATKGFTSPSVSSYKQCVSCIFWITSADKGTFCRFWCSTNECDEHVLIFPVTQERKSETWGVLSSAALLAFTFFVSIITNCS